MSLRGRPLPVHSVRISADSAKRLACLRHVRTNRALHVGIHETRVSLQNPEAEGEFSMPDAFKREAGAGKLAAMTNKVFPAWMLATAFCFVGSAQTSPVPADEQAVEQTLRLMYVALTKEDTVQLRAVTTSDFYAFDGGEQMTGDELMALIKRLHAAGKTFVWTVTEPKARIEGTVAWITYLNRGAVQDAAGKKDVSWLANANSK